MSIKNWFRNIAVTEARSKANETRSLKTNAYIEDLEARFASLFRTCKKLYEECDMEIAKLSFDNDIIAHRVFKLETPKSTAKHSAILKGIEKKKKDKELQFFNNII